MADWLVGTVGGTPRNVREGAAPDSRKGLADDDDEFADDAHGGHRAEVGRDEVEGDARRLEEVVAHQRRLDVCLPGDETETPLEAPQAALAAADSVIGC